MKYFYLITGMVQTEFGGYVYKPDPALFASEREVKKYIKLNTEKNLHFTYERIRLGTMELNKRGK